MPFTAGRSAVTRARKARSRSTAVRGGDTPSSHTVYFFGDGERLEITHHCLNWKGCAKGAVNACIWMAGKPAGLYGIRESMGL
jgi:4-hydroxy-tetrahydrodipicolinate reductase